MRAVIIVAALAGVAHADEQGSCVMTCTDPQHCTTGCGGTTGGDSSSSGGDAQLQAAFAAEREQLRQIDADNAARESARKRVEKVRSLTQKGIDAYRRKDWRHAIELFDGALRRDPNNAVLQADLAQAERALADERSKREQAISEQHEKQLAAARAAALAQLRTSYDAEQHALARKLVMKPVPAPDPSSFTVAADAKLPDLPVAMPDVRAGAQAIFELSQARAKNDLFDEAKGMLDTMTADGLFVGEKVNEVTLATKFIPDLITRAASGSLTLEEAEKATLRAVTILFNTGSAPGELAQKIVEVGNAGKVIADEANKSLHDAAEHGIIRLTGAAGERAIQAAHVADDYRSWAEARGNSDGAPK